MFDRSAKFGVGGRAGEGQRAETKRSGAANTFVSVCTCRPACRTQGPRTRHRTRRALLGRSHFGSSTQICPHAPGGVPMTPSHPSRTLLLLPRRRLATPRRMSGSVHSASTTSSTATSDPSGTLCGAERRSCGAADERASAPPPPLVASHLLRSRRRRRAGHRRRRTHSSIRHTMICRRRSRPK
jgi:hypothetical protein